MERQWSFRTFISVCCCYCVCCTLSDESIIHTSYFAGRANVLPQHCDRVVAWQEFQGDDPREVLGGARFQPHGGEEERPARRLSRAWVSTNHNMWSTHEKEIILVICVVWGNPTIRLPRGVFWSSLGKYLPHDSDNWKFTHMKCVIEPTSKHTVEVWRFRSRPGFRSYILKSKLEHLNY